MLIDCDTCAARDIHCGDCVVAVLLGPRNGSIELDSAEQDALGAFASGGLLPPLRLVPTFPAAGSPTDSPPHRKPTRRTPPGRTAIA
ncbi:MAG: hypothetical protein M3Y89_15240 [Actinomycetota bacterium]|nr:hypothetical protein [Actinomycetota bacterium]